MLDAPVRPQFGGKLRSDEYFSAVNTVIATLRNRATLRTICLHLNALNLTTPSGLEFNRARLANYLQQNEISTITNEKELSNDYQ